MCLEKKLMYTRQYGVVTVHRDNLTFTLLAHTM